MPQDIPASGYAVHDASGHLSPYQFTRKAPEDKDVAIQILWTGICHSDIHTAKGDWGAVNYPMVPGHEIVGKVTKVGPKVTKYSVGDTVGVGCFVNSCRQCQNCQAGEESYCLKGFTGTYNGQDKHGQPTAGGYSNVIVVDEDFVLRIPEGMTDLAKAAPLLCAGITTYSPLKHCNVGPGTKVGVAGLGGVGHMAVKIASAMGAEVTVISTSEGKRVDAERLGAKKFFLTTEDEQWDRFKGYFNVIVDTISANHDVEKYLTTLALDGKHVLIGLPTEPLKVKASALISGRRSVMGSLIGGIRETQEMLDFCAKHGVLPDVEVVPPSDLNKAWERVLKNDVKYRFVIDISKM